MSGAGAYQKVMHASPRHAEANIFRRVVFGLKHAQASSSLSDRIKAVTATRVLWTTLLADLSGEGNSLPLELRRSLAIVGLSIVREIDSNDYNDVDLAFLIGLNQNILAGLEGNAA